MTISTPSSEGITTFSTRAERYAAGKVLRAKAPRTSHGEWAAASDRQDPISLLEESNRIRVPELVLNRYGRMSISPYTGSVRTEITEKLIGQMECSPLAR